MTLEGWVHLSSVLRWEAQLPTLYLFYVTGHKMPGSKANSSKGNKKEINT